MAETGTNLAQELPEDTVALSTDQDSQPPTEQDANSADGQALVAPPPPRFKYIFVREGSHCTWDPHLQPQEVSELPGIPRHAVQLLLAPESGPNERSVGPTSETRSRPTNRNLRSPTLQSQLEQIPTDIRSLLIDNDVPTDEEWATLGAHFTSIENLELNSGFGEELNDALVPSHWPLKRILYATSCAEVIQNPHVLLGRVPHLIFMLTSGMRFEGPLPDALSDAHHQAIVRGEKKNHCEYDDGVIINQLPILVQDWERTKYSKGSRGPSRKVTVNPDLQIDPNAIVPTDDPDPDAFKLTHAEFIENDAIQQFLRFAMALPHLAYNLRHLKIVTTQALDCRWVPDSIFLQIVTYLHQLECLDLTVGEVFPSQDIEETPVPKLYFDIPQNLKTLRFRGPVRLTRCTTWQQWIDAFGDPRYIPNLERVSFVCDLAYEPHPPGAQLKNRRPATEEELSTAKFECDRLLEAMRNRGGRFEVQVEPYNEEWAGQHRIITQVDERWW